jgi:SAM-dependent methyltransferase
MHETRDEGEYRTRLLEVSRLTAPAIDQAIAALGARPGGSVLDLGCGIGFDTVRLARVVGAGGRVVGLDLSETFLEDARRRLAASGVPARVELRHGDLAALPFEEDSFDLVWCKDVLWGHRADPIASLTEMKRVLRPGGEVALAFWCSQVLLPGHPALEARLTQELARTTPYTASIAPDRHFMRALGWMRAAGLQDLDVQSSTTTVHAPSRPPTLPRTFPEPRSIPIPTAWRAPPQFE